MSEKYLAVIGDESDGELVQVKLLRFKGILGCTKYLVMYSRNLRNNGEFLYSQNKTTWVKHLYVYRGESFKEASL